VAAAIAAAIPFSRFRSETSLSNVSPTNRSSRFYYILLWREGREGTWEVASAQGQNGQIHQWLRMTNDYGWEDYYCSQERFPDVPGVTAHTIEIPWRTQTRSNKKISRFMKHLLLVLTTDVVSPQHSLPSSLHCCHSLRAVSGEKFFPATSRKCKPGRSPAVIRSWSGSLDFAVFTFASMEIRTWPAKWSVDPFVKSLLTLSKA